MNIVLTPHFKRDYMKLPRNIKKQTDRKLGILEEDISYPSLRVKRVRRYKKGIFEGSVTKKYRFLFKIMSDSYVMLRIDEHDILEKR